jgi:hypothetical protein
LSNLVKESQKLKTNLHDRRCSLEINEIEKIKRVVKEEIRTENVTEASTK